MSFAITCCMLTSNTISLRNKRDHFLTISPSVEYYRWIYDELTILSILHLKSVQHKSQGNNCEKIAQRQMLLPLLMPSPYNERDDTSIMETLAIKTWLPSFPNMTTPPRTLFTTGEFSTKHNYILFRILPIRRWRQGHPQIKLWIAITIAKNDIFPAWI